MYVTFHPEEVADTQEMIDDLCRPEKVEVVLGLTRAMGHALIDAAMMEDLNTDELLCITYVMTDAMNLAADKYEEIIERNGGI